MLTRRSGRRRRAHCHRLHRGWPWGGRSDYGARELIEQLSVTCRFSERRDWCVSRLGRRRRARDCDSDELCRSRLEVYRVARTGPVVSRPPQSWARQRRLGALDNYDLDAGSRSRVREPPVNVTPFEERAWPTPAEVDGSAAVATVGRPQRLGRTGCAALRHRRFPVPTSPAPFDPPERVSGRAAGARVSGVHREVTLRSH
jgi:hypothetical protein